MRIMSQLTSLIFFVFIPTSSSASQKLKHVKRYDAARSDSEMFFVHTNTHECARSLSLSHTLTIGSGKFSAFRLHQRLKTVIAHVHGTRKVKINNPLYFSIRIDVCSNTLYRSAHVQQPVNLFRNNLWVLYNQAQCGCNQW